MSSAQGDRFREEERSERGVERRNKGGKEGWRAGRDWREGGIGGYEGRWESRTGEEGGRGGKERSV